MVTRQKLKKPKINKNNFKGDPVFCRECSWSGLSGELTLDTIKEMFACPECGNDVNLGKEGEGDALSKPPF